MSVTHDAVQSARRADLYGFLLKNHPNDITAEGDSVRLLRNHSVSVRTGYAGYTDFTTGETGNGVDLLTRYLDYDFQDAVTDLCGFMGVDPQAGPDSIDLARLGEPRRDAPGKAPLTLRDAGVPDKPVREFRLPARMAGRYHGLFAYLNVSRGIPMETIQRLIDMNILYQEADSGHGNIIFADPAGTFYEARGTYPGKPFHQVQFSNPDAFWWFKTGSLDSVAARAYVCESAIDAVSLYLIHNPHLALSSPYVGITDPYAVGFYQRKATRGENALYCSIGGVANQRRIDAIKNGMRAAGCPAFLAVDNDNAGELCRQRNPDMQALVPRGVKDWNDYLKTCLRDDLTARLD